MLLLIDMDIIVYRAGFASERRYSYRDDEGNLDHTYDIEPKEHALFSAKKIMQSLISKFDCPYKGYLTAENDKTNFRHSIATIKEYKGNRKGAKKPDHYHAVREYLQRFWDAQVITGQEADDQMGIDQYQASEKRRALLNSLAISWIFEKELFEDKDGPETMICSIDKDLDMIPGWHYNFVRNKKYFVAPPEDIKFFYKQILSGDTADNIPGVGGYGSKKAHLAIDHCTTEKECFETVLDIYKKRGYDEKRLLEVGQLLWIRRKSNEMWEFPK